MDVLGAILMLLVAFGFFVGVISLIVLVVMAISKKNLKVPGIVTGSAFGVSLLAFIGFIILAVVDPVENTTAENEMPRSSAEANNETPTKPKTSATAGNESEKDDEETEDESEKESSNPRSEVTDEEKAEMKQEYDDKKAAEEKAEEERIAKEDAEKQKEEEETPLTAAEEIENIIADVVGKDKITELNVEEADGSYEVDLTYAASENFTTNMTASGIKRNMVDIALKLQESEHYVSYLLMAATLPLTDSTGNESDGEVMTVSFYGETIEQLNPDNEVFLYDNLESAADGFSAHPDFRE